MPASDKAPRVAYVGGPDISARIPLLNLLKEAGARVAAVGTNPKECRTFEDAGIPFFRYRQGGGINPLNDAVGVATLYNIFKREGFDIVHAFDTRPTIFARTAASMAGVPVIIGTVPGLGSVFSGRTLVKNVLSRFYVRLQKSASNASDLTIFQNADDLRFFVDNGMVAASKAAIVRGSGVDVQRFSPEAVDKGLAKRLREEAGAAEGGMVVTMAARLVKEKGVMDYLRAASNLKERFPEAVFLLIGPEGGSLSPVKAEEIKRHGNAVKYLGPRREMPEWLYISDIVVLPSYYREGVPRILLEAGCMGKPLVTTNLPGCRDTVDEGKNGFIVPPKDPAALAEAIERLITDAHLRRLMGVRSRAKIADEFGLERVSSDLLKIYSGLLKEKGLGLVLKGKSANDITKRSKALRS